MIDDVVEAPADAPDEQPTETGTDVTDGLDPMVVPPVDPTFKIGELIDLERMHGIEIGALHNPRLPRDHPNVKYVDHATTEELHEKYKDDPVTGPHVHRAVPVDYVLRPGARLIDALGDDAPVDFVIASHVIEHIPDPVGWLHDIGDVLVEGGILALVVPDRRFTFDVNRRDSTLAELVGAHLDRRELPSPQQIFDFEVNLTPSVDVIAAWEGEDVTGVVRPDHPDAPAFALERCRAQVPGGDYIDVHCTVYTPDSFLELYQHLVRLELVDLELVRFYTTEYGHLEFFATLRKITAPTAQDRARMIATAAACRRQVAWRPTAPEPDPEPDPEPVADPAPEPQLDAERAPWADQPGRVDLDVSPLEARAIAAKRALTGVVRDTARRIRRLTSR